MWASETTVRRKFEQDGWSILRNGWPDFLIFKEKKGKVIAKGIEVKGSWARLTDAQTKMHEILRKVGIEVQTISQGQALAHTKVKREHMERECPHCKRPYTIYARPPEEQEKRDLAVLIALKNGGLSAANKMAKKWKNKALSSNTPVRKP